jgi:hypothetical protein
MISAKEAVQIAKKELVELNFEKPLDVLALEGISHARDVAAFRFLDAWEQL